MRLAILHRRLTTAMGLAAFGALAAGAGVTPWTLVFACVLAVQLFRSPDERIGRLAEHVSRVVAGALFLWVLYVGLVIGGDVLPPSLALLFVLLVGETLRPLDAENDFRLYSLSFAVVIAATAYYPGIGFGLAFTAYIVLVTLALMVGHLRRQAERFEIADLRIDRSFLVVTAALSIVTLLASVVIFVAFPRMPRSWFGQGRPASGVVAGFSDEISIGQHGARLQSNPDVMFRVEFETGRPPERSELYWRGRSFDRFDGVRWSRGLDPWVGMAYYPAFPYEARWGGTSSEYTIYGGPGGVRVLFGQHPVIRVRPHSAIRPWFRRSGDLVYDGADSPVYTVQSGATRPPEKLLREAPDGLPPNGERYLQLPRLDPRVARLADSLTAPHGDRLSRVRAVEAWFREEFRYTLDLPRSASEATVEHFLFDRRAGHCEYFSTGMAVLLRAAGIPARNVNGFLGGEWNESGGYLAVTGNSAHSWVEVWFPDLGWVPFDATPPAGRDEVLGAAGASEVWPVLFWLDSVQFRWYRWVLAYDLSVQRDLLRSIGDRFSAASSPRRPGSLPWRPLLGWMGIATGVLTLVWLLRGRRWVRQAPATRIYLMLRRAYSRAGYPVPATAAPLAFIETLRQTDAPAADAAARIVDAYLRTRFAVGEEPDLAQMKADLALVNRTLRSARSAGGGPEGRYRGGLLRAVR